MKYTVIWTQLAEDALAALWADADPELRPQITYAIEVIERALTVSPEMLGESRIPPARIVIKRPVVILFEVHPSAQMVKVNDVRLVLRKR